MSFADDLNMLVYFWEEKGDVTRYTGWEAMQPELAKRCPEVIKAWNDYNMAHSILGHVLRGAADQQSGAEAGK